MTQVALVGCGRWGRNILRDLLVVGARVHVADPDPFAREAALRAGASSIAAGHVDLPAVDGVVVAVPPPLTAGVILDLLDRAVPVFAEKPLALSPADADEVVARGADRVFVMDKWRHHPGVVAAGELLAQGVIGEVHTIRTVRWGWWDHPRDVSALWYLGSHDLSMVLHWLGHVPPARWARRLGEPGRDSVTAGLGGGDDPDVVLDISTTSPEHRRAFTIVGRAGSLHLADADAPALMVRTFDGATREVRLVPSMPLAEEVSRFVEHLRGGPPPLSSAADGREVVRRLADLDRLAIA